VKENLMRRCLGLVLTLLMLAFAASAHAATKPTVVLVHGAWADSGAWDGVTARLQARGYPVRVVATPLRSLSGDAAYVSSLLVTIPGPVVLVGHSYGGAVVTNAAAANVKRLVYVDAFAPDQGETVLQLATQRPGSALAADPMTVFDPVPYPGAPAGDVDLYVKPSLFPEAFANDLSRRRGRVLAAAQRPVTFSALGAPSGPPAWKTIPSWYLVGTIDHVIPPAEQRFMAHRAGSHTVSVRASHLPMVSRPARVAQVIERAAAGVRG
jgi:pimeloyl-ACP methyl ester carboxylesterase